MKNKVIIVFVFLFLFSASGVFSFDVWQNPEMAEKYTVFAGSFIVSFTVSYTELGVFDLGLSSPEIFFDLMLPLPLPFSLGFSTVLLKPETFGIGARLGYHVNFNDPNLDVYALYCLKLEFIEDTSAYLEWYPAIGFRRRFGFFCLNLETNFAAKSLLIGFSIKLN